MWSHVKTLPSGEHIIILRLTVNEAKELIEKIESESMILRDTRRALRESVRKCS